MRLWSRPLEVDGVQEIGFPSGESVFLARDVCTWTALRHAVSTFLDSASLPAGRSARILLKPNFNNDLVALTGNATDLRLLRALFEALQARGYRNLTVADGPNFGIRRKGINVLRRLAVDRLASLHDVQVRDLNDDEPRTVLLVRGRETGLAMTCLKADFVLNLAKLKTHAEAGMSLACKNMIGCNVAGYKRRVHDDLPRAIVRLARLLPAGLHIVDGLVAMEGNGPGAGTPRELGLLFAGRNPFLLDAAIAQWVGIGPASLPYLAVARTEGLLSDEDWAAVTALEPLTTLEPAPRPPWITRVLTRNELSSLRDAVRPLFDNRLVRELLQRAGVVQDVYETAEAQVTLKLRHDVGLARLSAYCPMELDIAAFRFDPAESRCIHCLYCYWLDRDGAIEVQGELGHLATHLRRYRALVRTRVGDGWEAA
jgi:uncharacterized protein (DUF362 family)